MVKIAHLTSAHPRFDTRIFVKECKSLALKGYDCHLVVADGLGEECVERISIHDVGKLDGRLKRIFLTTRNVFKKALEVDATIYHLHDPELIPIGLKLKKKGKRVIFDSHEDVAKQMLSKPYLNKLLLRIISVIYRFYEKYSLAKMDYIVTATPSIRDKFLSNSLKTIDINNYPVEDDYLKNELKNTYNSNKISYLGGISEIRGVWPFLEAIESLKGEALLDLVGSFSSDQLEKEVKKKYGASPNIIFRGELKRSSALETLTDSQAGIVTFLEVPNHVDAQPNKMFEYMSLGLPVISSNFPLWRNIVEKYKCGICVDPISPEEIANAIRFLVQNPETAREMGQNGRVAIETKFNWKAEEIKLFQVYEEISRY